MQQQHSCFKHTPPQPTYAVNVAAIVGSEARRGGAQAPQGKICIIPSTPSYFLTTCFNNQESHRILCPMHHHKQLVHIPPHTIPQAVAQVISLQISAKTTAKTRVSAIFNTLEQETLCIFF